MLVREVAELDAVLQAVLAFQKQHYDETLVILTADHETGGLELTDLKEDALAALVEQQAPLSASGNDPEKMRQCLNLKQDSLSAAEKKLLSSAETAAKPAKKQAAACRALCAIRDARCGISFSTVGHTKTPVMLYASGPQSRRFLRANLENCDVPNIIKAIVTDDETPLN